MSLYNTINGVSPATFLILPMLGKHPDYYPRFRDCFLKDEERPEFDNHIIVYTRTGGGNREAYESDNDLLTLFDTYVTDYDDGFDSTYANWVFSVPKEWQKDYDKILAGKLTEVSQEYKDKVIEMFSKLEAHLKEAFTITPQDVESGAAD